MLHVETTPFTKQDADYIQLNVTKCVAMYSGGGFFVSEYAK